MSETLNETSQDPAATEELQEGAEKKPEPKEPKWFTDRIGELTRARRDAEREAAAAKAELQRVTQKLPEAERPAPKPDIEALIEGEITKRETKKRLENWEKTGIAEFPDFTERCNAIAALGATEKPDFMTIILDMEDGHKVVAALADEPGEAARILKLPMHKMALELAKLAEKPSAVRPVSKAPPPPRSIDGAARGAKNDPNTMSVADHRKAIFERRSR